MVKCKCLDQDKLDLRFPKFQSQKMGFHFCVKAWKYYDDEDWTFYVHDVQANRIADPCCFCLKQCMQYILSPEGCMPPCSPRILILEQLHSVPCNPRLSQTPFTIIASLVLEHRLPHYAFAPPRQALTNTIRRTFKAYRPASLPVF